MGWLHPIQDDLPLPFLESFSYTHPDMHFCGDSKSRQVGSEAEPPQGDKHKWI